jgi:hypothetical protein
MRLGPPCRYAVRCRYLDVTEEAVVVEEAANASVLECAGSIMADVVSVPGSRETFPKGHLSWTHARVYAHRVSTRVAVVRTLR